MSLKSDDSLEGSLSSESELFV